MDVLSSQEEELVDRGGAASGVVPSPDEQKAGVGELQSVRNLQEAASHVCWDLLDSGT